MRTRILVALSLGILLGTHTPALAQEERAADVAQDNPAEAAHKTPLQILDECIQAIEQQDIATYVDHLSPDEQRTQAGFALVLSTNFLPALTAQSAQAEPELLLLLRAVGDLVREHSASESKGYGRAPAAAPLLSLVTSSNRLVAQPHALSAASTQDILMSSADRLKDPRLFLIDVIAEFARPVEITGVQPERPPYPSYMAEYAKLYKQQEWTLYTRGDYAVAVPASNGSSPSDDDEAKASAEQANQMLRVEFRKVQGVWKISHLIPVEVCREIASTPPGFSYAPEGPAAAPYPAGPVAPEHP